MMPGAQWLELLCRHIPDRFEHLVRYVGWYSNRVRARRAAAAAVGRVVREEIATRARASWARLIKKVYEVDPLECPKCKGPMRVIALINDACVVQRILKHLGLWAPRQNERAPPALDTELALPADNVLTYHPVPDIA